MARAADGTMTLSGTFAIADTIPVSSTINGYISDILTELTDSWCRSGKGAALAHLSMGSFKLTTMADGVALTDAATVKQVQNHTVSWVDGGGTADAITATYSPVITAVVDGMILRTRATAANATTTPTFAPNGLTARTIVKLHDQALVAGDISGDGHELLLQYQASNTTWKLLNPATVSGVAVSATSLANSGATTFTGIVSASVTADQTDYAPTGHATATTFRLTPDAARTINSLDGAVAGRKIYIINASSTGANTLTLLHDDGATGTAAMRFFCHGSNSIVMPGRSVVECIYDGTSSRWRVFAMVPASTQADMEAATSVNTTVSPGVLHNHPAACKFWVESLTNSTTIELDYNVDSVADTATGTATYTITTDFSSVDWACQVSRAEDDLTLVYSATYNAKAAGSVAVNSVVEAGGGSDPSSSSGNATWSCCGFGDQ